MNSIQFPSIFVKLLFKFYSVFTSPSFKYFEKIIACILLGRPKKAVTAAAKLAQEEKRFSNFNRFVSRYRWDTRELRIKVGTFFVSTFFLQQKAVAFRDLFV